MYTYELKALLGPIMMYSIVLTGLVLVLGLCLCKIAETIKKEIKRRNAIKNKKIAQKRQAIAQIAKEKNELRLAHIRRAQGIL
jgi:lipopolysaccharide export LptBFGC system permease protein LptF